MTLNGRQVWTPSALLAENLGDVKFLIEPICTPGSVLVAFGPREAGKTQLFFTMARAMHEEQLLLGRFPCRRGRVALVEVDMSIMTTQERLKKATADYTFDDSLFSIAMPPTLDILHCTPHTPWVRELTAFAPDVVAFDSLRKIYRGDENSPGTPSLVYGKCKELFPKAAFWFAHHVKKPPATWLQEKEKYDPGEDLNVYRGTTAWLDDADAAVYLHKEPKNDKRTFRLVRARYAPDHIKREVIGVTMHKDSMFLESGVLSERQWALHWRMAHVDAVLEEAVKALEGEFPKRSPQSYYNWAHAAEDSIPK